MGIYLNPQNDKFKKALNSSIYVDKTGLISYTNKVLHTENQNICISRPRRFGKSMAANMLTAYYSKGCNSYALFSGYSISEDAEFTKHLNKYHVISVNMQEFLSNSNDVDDMIEYFKEELLEEILLEIHKTEPFYQPAKRNALNKALYTLYELTEIGIIFIIDEWDCVMREYKVKKSAQEQYLDFLRDLLKDKGYIYLAYMTGILPVKKYGTHSALNMFDEFSMLSAGPLAGYVGFTESEVKRLCREYQMDFEETKNWYDGYSLKGIHSVYSPRSVVSCMQFREYGTYWNQTETFEALQIYIDMNFDGLKDNIITMMAGIPVPVKTGSFANDMTTFASKDDVLTLLIHLGYLGYDAELQKVFIPNYEVMNEYANAIRSSDWGEVSRALEFSMETLRAIWNKDENRVAEAVEEAHLETSHLQYNDENALSYTISLALYSARNYYTVVRELPTGKGYADLVYIPRKRYSDKPALLVELKWDKTSEGAIEQIKNKSYVKAMEEYKGKLLLVGINYNLKSRHHTCRIEEWNAAIKEEVFPKTE